MLKITNLQIIYLTYRTNKLNKNKLFVCSVEFTTSFLIK